MRRILFSIAVLAGLSGVASGQTSLASEIAPGGKLRVGMIAIAVLGGVGELVARFIGQKLGTPVELVMYPNPDATYKASAKTNGILPLDRASSPLRVRRIPRRAFGSSTLSMSADRKRNFPIFPQSINQV